MVPSARGRSLCIHRVPACRRFERRACSPRYTVTSRHLLRHAILERLPANGGGLDTRAADR